jgi:hypothetical protein
MQRVFKAQENNCKDALIIIFFFFKLMNTLSYIMCTDSNYGLSHQFIQKSYYLKHFSFNYLYNEVCHASLSFLALLNRVSFYFLYIYYNK